MEIIIDVPELGQFEQVRFAACLGLALRYLSSA